MNYAIVIPAKDEEGNIAGTLSSVVSQTLLPVICLVVDDGSTDDTPQIIKTYEDEYSFIEYYKNEGAKEYVLGGHVVQVFNKGKQLIDEMGLPYDFIVKMDADISFEPEFMEQLFDKINVEEWGVVSGTPYYLQNGKKIYEYSPTWHSRGQFKVYNNSALSEMGGLKPSLGWDCADNIIAMESGWRTEAFRDISYQMHRKVGGKSSLIKGRINHGKGAYALGYSLPYLLLRALHDVFKPPYLLGACYLLFGYFAALFSSARPLLNRSQRTLLRKLLWSSLFSRFSNRDFIIFQQLKRQRL